MQLQGCMRRLLSALALTLAFSSFGSAYAERVSIAKIKPSQEEYGAESVGQMVSRLKREAAAQGRSLHWYTKNVLAPELEKKHFVGFLSRNGERRTNDGHHRIWAIQHIARELHIRIDTNFDAIVDGTKMSKQAYHETLEAKNIGYFTPEHQALPAEQRYKHMPSTFLKMKNSNARSAVGHTFFLLHIPSEVLVDYAEFKLAEVLHATLTPRAEKLFAHPLKMKTVRYLQNQLRTNPTVHAAFLDLARDDAGRKLLTDLLDGKHRAEQNPATGI